MEMRENNRLRFGIKSLLLAAAAVAVMCALFVAARNQYYADRRQVHFVLAEVDGISITSLHSHIDVTEEINSTSILKEKLGTKRILLNNDQRRRLGVKGKILGRKLLEEFGTLFTPNTILR